MKKIAIFEVEGGSDKGPDGHRKDTMPIVDAISAKEGFEAKPFFYKSVKRDEIMEELLRENYVGYISRINPSRDFDEKTYFAFLDSLVDAGLVGMPQSKDMRNMGAKDALVKLAKQGNINFVDKNTDVYYTMEELKNGFPKSLAQNDRVLKQNRGSTGEGIWRVVLKDREKFTGDAVPMDAIVVCTEAVDNKSYEKSLADFMDFCEQYINGENGMLVDMRYLERIVEGEVRILMIADKPMLIVHKKPVDSVDAFSATLFSGAKYTSYDVDSEKYRSLISGFLASLNDMADALEVSSLPLIWTADFIPVTASDGSDSWGLSELNCSCVGITTNLEMATVVADAVEKMVS
jgi:glutathione synthase/RimK-type ligase-like ATP-grasp enzyme